MPECGALEIVLCCADFQRAGVRVACCASCHLDGPCRDPWPPRYPPPSGDRHAPLRTLVCACVCCALGGVPLPRGAWARALRAWRARPILVEWRDA